MKEPNQQAKRRPRQPAESAQRRIRQRIESPQQSDAEPQEIPVCKELSQLNSMIVDSICRFR